MPKIAMCANKRGSVHLDVTIDSGRMELYCTATIAIFGGDSEYPNGYYKEYDYATLKAAHRKYEELKLKLGDITAEGGF